MAGCHAQKFSSLFFYYVINIGNTSCSFPAAFSYGVIQQAKGIYSRIHFFPHYCSLIKMELTGQQLIHAQVRSQSHTLTGFQKPTDQLLLFGGLPCWGLFVSFGRWEELQSYGKKSHSSLPVSTTIIVINRIKNIHTRDGKFWVFNYFKIHLNFDEA